MSGRPLDELTRVPDPAWPALAKLLDDADAVVLPVDPDRADEVLLALQVSVGSVLGALAHSCGGVLVDHGWLRLLGGGGGALPDIATVNDLREPTTSAPAAPPLVVAFDALGGEFAIDGGTLGIGPGEVCYRGPDSLSWVGLGIGHAAFVVRMLTGALSEFYADLRWPGWEDEISALQPDQGLSIYPPPFSEEGRDISATLRRAVPFAELRAVYAHAAEHLGLAGPTTSPTGTCHPRPAGSDEQA